MGQEYLAEAVAHSLEDVSVFTLSMHEALGDQSVSCAEEVLLYYMYSGQNSDR